MNPHSRKKWIVALFATLLTTRGMGWYTVLRYASVDLFVLNKAVGNSALFLLCVVLFTGPVARLFPRYAQGIFYRRELGMCTFSVALLHGVFSLFFLPQFPLSHYLTYWPGFIAACVSLGVLTWLFIISFHRVVSLFRGTVWWAMHQWGVRVAGIAALLHTQFKKIPEWVSWYSKTESTSMALPPLSLIVGIIAVSVVGIRICEALFPVQKARVASGLLFVTCFIFLVSAFWWSVF